MKYLSEMEAENLLEGFGFSVVLREACSKEHDIPRILQGLKLPVVMKVLGDKIVHKKKLGGVNTNVNNYSEALSEFRRMKKIKGAKGVMFQEKIPFTREFLVGIKKTEDFGHVVVFGSGGSLVEEKKDIAFRVVPLSHDDCMDLIREVEITKDVGSKEAEKISNILIMVSDLVRDFPNIEEMDINPLVLSGKGPVVLDARILLNWNFLNWIGYVFLWSDGVTYGNSCVACKNSEVDYYFIHEC